MTNYKRLWLVLKKAIETDVVRTQVEADSHVDVYARKFGL